MRNAGLEEAQAGIKIAGRNIMWLDGSLGLTSKGRAVWKAVQERGGWRRGLPGGRISWVKGREMPNLRTC